MLVVALLVAGVAGVRQLVLFQKCPECRSLVPMKARRCKHCGSEII